MSVGVGEGRREGRKEGRGEGRKEGRGEGRKEGRIERGRKREVGGKGVKHGEGGTS